MNETLKISIQTPCSANWEDMNPAQKGRFCSLCNLTVVDFTCMTDHEIKDYFIQIKGQKTCGRFRAAQLNSSTNEEIPVYAPKGKNNLRILFRKTILVGIAFLALLVGCRKSSSPVKPYMMGAVAPETMGEPTMETVDTLKTNPTPSHMIMGDTTIPIQEEDKKIKK